MGLYDYIICRMQLPGRTPTWVQPDHPFQTKSLECWMKTYTIDEDGAFSEVGYTGIIEFYDSNVVGSGPALYTRDGEDSEWVEYKAVVERGYVTSLEQTEYKRQAAWPSSKQQEYWNRKNTVDKALARLAESNLVGQRLYIFWGGQDKGYWVKVLLQNKRQLCVEHEADSKFHRKESWELLDPRHAFGRTIWDDEEKALSARVAEKKIWDDAKAEYEQFIANNTIEPEGEGG